MSKVVLLISYEHEPNLPMIKDVLNYRKIMWRQIDITAKRREKDLFVEIGDGGDGLFLIDSYGASVFVEDIVGVWCRSAGYFQNGQPKRETVDNFVRHEEVYTFEYFWYLLNGVNWVNPIYSMFLSRRAVANKLIQLRVARDIGFVVPDTLVTNSPEKMIEFVRMGPCINKQISQGSVSESGPIFVKTSLVDEGDIKCGEVHSGCPVMLQRYVKKDYEIRATVVGNGVFAAAIDTAGGGSELVDSRDWVSSDISYYRIKLSKSEEEMLLKMNKILGLRYSAFDLVRDVNGCLVFLETNPSGQWGFIESLTGYAITESIVKELVDE